MKFNRKAQSALEFLTTYGWAFLVILIMIAALAYFGVLDPSRFLPDACLVPAGFVCNGVVANGDAFQIAVENGQGSQITINPNTDGSTSFTNLKAGTLCTVGTITADPPPVGGALPLTGGADVTATWGSGVETIFVINCGIDQLTQDAKQGGVLRIPYSQAGSALVKTLTIDINAEVNS